MSSEDKSPDDEVLLEKVRELETRKRSDGDREQNSALVLRETRRLGPVLDERIAGEQMRKFSRRGFLGAAIAVVGGYLGYRWVSNPQNGSIFTRTFRLNEWLSQAYFSPNHLAKEFPRSAAAAVPRVNGLIGFNEDFDPTEWSLNVLGIENAERFSQFSSKLSLSPLGGSQAPVQERAGLLLSLGDIKSLPRTEMTTELKCIEGWSMIVNWAGVRFSDFVGQYTPAFSKYVSLVTPDGGYFVGWDMQSILHPQTLLAYEMNGQPLKLEHGAPLRLVSTTKYGIKQIKRIGTIEFSDTRPRDYWAEDGYDWYSGH